MTELARLAAGASGAEIIGDGRVEITAVAYDSREAAPGALFVAISGFKADGHAYLGRALEAGASAAVVQRDHEDAWRPLAGRGASLVVVPDTRAALAEIAAAFYGYAAREVGVIGVTGTDGKTSLSHLIAHVLESAGEKTGLISTAECRIGEVHLPDTGRFTTPEAPEVQRMLRQIADAGCRWAVVEATSHGLALHRLDRCDPQIAVFTNVGRDHLEFHGTVKEYLAAKGILFRMLDQRASAGGAATAVLNLDDPAHAYFRGLTSARVLTYGLGPSADVRASGMVEEGWSTRFLLCTPLGDRDAVMPKPGGFNMSNALASTAVAMAAGAGLDDVVRAIGAWPGAPGRMEIIDEGQPFTVVVDFAHAPDSLRRVLQLLRSRSRGRLIAVFGCIGERDRDRRAGMGKAAAELADYTVVTDDNPYSENRDVVIADIATALRAEGRKEGHDFAVVPDRREAIAQALGMAVDEDAVLLAGKGHERDVHLADSVYDCDDRDVSRRVLREMGYRR